jgi:putative endonuclease
MGYYLYVIRSGESQYVGVTKNIKERLDRHNSGQNRSTKHRKDWKLIYFERYNTSSEARKAEVKIKRSGQKIGVGLL